MLEHVVEQGRLQLPVRRANFEVEQVEDERHGVHHVREHLHADGVNAVVQIHAHHARYGAHASASLLLGLGGEHSARAVRLRGAETYHQAYHRAYAAPLQHCPAALPQLRCELEEVDLALVLRRGVALLFHIVVCHVIVYSLRNMKK